MARKYRFITIDLAEAVFGEEWINHHIESLTTYGVLILIGGVKYYILEALSHKITSKDMETLEKFIKDNETILSKNKAIK